jgi:oxygen-independent coproporphyrinogen-3 oxidase
MQADGLLQLEEDRLVVPESSRPFVRNICMAFDLRLMRNAPDTRIFSMTI